MGCGGGYYPGRLRPCLDARLKGGPGLYSGMEVSKESDLVELAAIAPSYRHLSRGLLQALASSAGMEVMFSLGLLTHRSSGKEPRQIAAPRRHVA